MSVDEEALGTAYDAARAAEDAGDIEAATRLFRRCLEIDPDDHCGVVMRLAKYGAATPAAAPPSYVATLFGQHAEAFDAILVGDLGYDVPAIARRLAGPFVTPPARMLDLGCGTGLAGVAFADLAGEIVGVDLAEEMLEMTDARGIYGDLYVAEAVAFLEEWDEAPFDLVVATDVWPYLGDLTAFAGAAARCLVPGGLLVASTERAEAGWRVTQTQRFAHAPAYIHATHAASGLEVVAEEPVTVRLEEGVPVPGDLFVLKKTG
ncbi:class I SAM-dependent DNA methyltransferase [Acuticoccus sediminis]|uniref:class I SAM-dependent DNA methyltransferase n=1 Tax=Acuticoccus sediminis TaxID=2184697 RepID=UPI001CFD5863|nr:methyltransferase domain-containing protein [Acuticoccus sediminis]